MWSWRFDIPEAWPKRGQGSVTVLYLFVRIGVVLYTFNYLGVEALLLARIAMPSLLQLLSSQLRLSATTRLRAGYRGQPPAVTLAVPAPRPGPPQRVAPPKAGSSAPATGAHHLEQLGSG